MCLADVFHAINYFSNYYWPFQIIYILNIDLKLKLNHTKILKIIIKKFKFLFKIHDKLTMLNVRNNNVKGNQKLFNYSSIYNEIVYRR